MQVDRGTEGNRKKNAAYRTKWQEIMIHYLYYFIPLPAESEILLTFKRRKHEELIDYGIFSQLDFAALCGDRGSNPVIVEKTTASLAEKTPVYWQKMADGMSQALIKHFWGSKLQRV